MSVPVNCKGELTTDRIYFNFKKTVMCIRFSMENSCIQTKLTDSVRNNGTKKWWKRGRKELENESFFDVVIEEKVTVFCLSDK